MKTRTVVRETMKTRTTIGRLCLTLAVLLGPCAASIAEERKLGRDKAGAHRLEERLKLVPVHGQGTQQGSQHPEIQTETREGSIGNGALIERQDLKGIRHQTMNNQPKQTK
jgi:hypothetical protein